MRIDWTDDCGRRDAVLQFQIRLLQESPRGGLVRVVARELRYSLKCLLACGHKPRVHISSRISQRLNLIVRPLLPQDQPLRAERQNRTYEYAQNCPPRCHALDTNRCAQRPLVLLQSNREFHYGSLPLHFGLGVILGSEPFDEPH